MNWSQRYHQLNAADLQHRLGRMIAFGKVAETDYEKARVKVTIGEWTTTWLPWVTARASNDVNWQALEVGEQVLVLSPSGDMAQGIVIGSVYQGQQQQVVSDVAPESRQNIHRTKYQDGTVIEYDRENHKLKADVQGDVELLVSKNLTAQVQENVTVTVQGNANVTVEGDLTANVTKSCNISAESITLTSTKNIDINAGQTLKLNGQKIEAL